jgi:hypothetical protein
VVEHDRVRRRKVSKYVAERATDIARTAFGPSCPAEYFADVFGAHVERILNDAATWADDGGDGQHIRTMASVETKAPRKTRP